MPDLNQQDVFSTEAPTPETSDFTSVSSEDQQDFLNKKVNSVPRPKRDIGLDTTQKIISEIAQAGITGQLDSSQLDAFFNLSTDRNQVYDLIDTMAEDPIIAAALEIYTEDTCAAGTSGDAIWAVAEDSDVQAYINYLMQSLQINSHIYDWAYSFIKYGDLYLKLFRKSDLEDPLFKEEDKPAAEHDQTILTEAMSGKALEENVKLIAHESSDPFTTYIEAVANPAEIYELTKFGKTYAYIKAEAPLSTTASYSDITSYNYNKLHSNRFKRHDIQVYTATDYVHATYNEACTRDPEKLYLYLTDNDYESDQNAYAYTVRRGRSLLCDAFKIWREITLLENSMLLNRLTRSSVLRIFNVEVGDMPKEQVTPHLQGVKSLVEQKSAFDVGSSMQEYVNPGPVENNVYIPQRNGIGSLSVQNIGGDIDVKGLNDVDYFKTKLYAILRIPKQYLGDTDDATGFNGGTSLSIISSRYARTVKRIQAILIDTITTLLNIFLISRGFQNYIGKFTLMMQSPVTQEDLDKASMQSTKVQVCSDLLSLVGDLTGASDRLKLEKLLVSSLDFVDPAVLKLIDECIDKLSGQGVSNDSAGLEFTPPFSSGGSGAFGGAGLGGSSPDANFLEPISSNDNEGPASSETSDSDLPSPDELGLDFTDM